MKFCKEKMKNIDRLKELRNRGGRMREPKNIIINGKIQKWSGA